ncbi:MAG: hypothetical protein HYY17_01110 [Planctomycetes bacterium]|nr:hypothetical protein [Planctomycetota bacterium]
MAGRQTRRDESRAARALLPLWGILLLALAIWIGAVVRRRAAERGEPPTGRSAYALESARTQPLPDRVLPSAGVENKRSDAALSNAKDDGTAAVPWLTEEDLDKALGRLSDALFGIQPRPWAPLDLFLQRLGSFREDEMGALVALMLINREARLDWEGFLFEVDSAGVREVMDRAALILSSADRPQLRVEAARAILNYFHGGDQIRTALALMESDPDPRAKAGMLDALATFAQRLDKFPSVRSRHDQRGLDDARSKYGEDSDEYLSLKAYHERIERRRSGRRDLYASIRDEILPLIVRSVASQVKPGAAPEMLGAAGAFLPYLARVDPVAVADLWRLVVNQPEQVQADFVRRIPSVDDNAGDLLLAMARRAQSPRLLGKAVWTLIWNTPSARQEAVVSALLSEPRADVRIEAIKTMEEAACSSGLDRALAVRLLEAVRKADPQEEVRTRASSALEVISPPAGTE